VVRRESWRVDGVPPLLSNVAARWLRVCAFFLDAAEAPRAGRAPLLPPPAVPRAAPHHSERSLEIPRHRRSDVAHSPATHRYDRAPLLRPLRHRSFDAAMVQRHQSRRLSLPALRPLQHRFPPRTPELSNFLRGPLLSPRTSRHVVGRPRPLRPSLWLLRPPRLETPARRRPRARFRLRQSGAQR